MTDIKLHLGDCLEVMASLPDGSVDAVICDPPYAEIDRSYGRMTEFEWHKLMDAVVVECRRVLKPTGSAMFVLQANQEHVGRTRPWLWEFMAKWSREWNMVQDAWWWNSSAPPTVHCHRGKGLMRPSLKACVWLGDPSCYRDQDSVLLSASEATRNDKRTERNELDYHPSGLSMRKGRALAAFRERGGVTPFNMLIVGNSDSQNSAGASGHGAGTPYPLADWWVRYISPPDGIVLDPFMGSGTIPVAAIARGRRIVGIERDPAYFAIAEQRIADARMRLDRPHAPPLRLKSTADACSLFDALEAS